MMGASGHVAVVRCYGIGGWLGGLGWAAQEVLFHAERAIVGLQPCGCDRGRTHGDCGEAV